jgi:hypothetical protein
MLTKRSVEERLQAIYGPLLYRCEFLDRDFQQIHVKWSDDKGQTRVCTELSHRQLQRVLPLLPPHRVAEYLVETREDSFEQDET